ncbi:NusA-like transcription termination signal-binding factor [archaeon]|nr:NusA-like transcription termination signal-binding factor [archaeon]
MNTVLDIDAIQKINFFEKITRVHVKDFIEDTQFIFIVNPGTAGKAIGKKAFNIKKLERLLKKRVKIVEYSIDPIKFIKSYSYPLDLKEITKNDDIIEVNSDTKTKGLLIGRNQKNLVQLNSLLKKYYNVQLKVK